MDGLIQQVSIVQGQLRKLRLSIAASPHSSEYEKSLRAIGTLTDALATDFDMIQSRGRKRPQDESLQTQVGSLQRKLRHQKQKVDAQEAMLADMQYAKTGGRIKNLWFVKVMLAAPGVPARTLSQWCRDWPTEETQNISPCYIGPVKDAMVEVLKKLNKEIVAASVRDAGVLEGGTETLPVYIVHVHDEAAMRLKSYVSEPSPRGRASKIQNHCVHVYAGQACNEVYTELQPLLKKDAQTIAFSLISTTKGVMEAILTGATQIPSQCTGTRVVHIIVGDGIHTNENACRRALQYYRQWAKQRHMRYSLIVVKCASHKANLVVQVAICGQVIRNALKNDALTGTCSRLFKYLMVDYLDEFSSNLRQVVMERLTLVHECEDAASVCARAASERFQQLYGKGVLPDALIAVLNQDILTWQHHCPANTDRCVVAARLYEVLNGLLLRLEARPVVTRFWLFTECAFALLLMDLLAVPSEVLSLTTTKAQKVKKVNSKRLTKVRAFFAEAGTPSLLRKVCLCLRLTLHAVNISSRTKTKDGDALPLFVRLAQREVQEKTAEELRDILPLLAFDPKLDVADTVLGLLTTQAHIVMRFDSYAGYAGKLWRACRIWNETGWPLGIKDFLETPADDMDSGYSADLLEVALSQGSLAQQADYMMSDPVQLEIEHTLRRILGNSLDVERKHHQDRCQEVLIHSDVHSKSQNKVCNI